MKKRLILLFVFAFMFSILSGCSKTEEAKNTDSKIETKSEKDEERQVNEKIKSNGDVIKVVDIAGREVEIERPVKTFIYNNQSALGEAFTLLGDEGADMLIGLREGRGEESFKATYGEKYPQLLDIERISMKQGAYDTEKIIKLNPDVVILSSQKAGQELEYLEPILNAGIPIITLSYNIEPLKNRVENIRVLGQVFGKEKRADEVIGFITKQYELVEERLKNIPEEERIFVHQTHFHGDIPKTFWSWSIIEETAGGKEIANHLESGIKLENGGTVDNEYLIKKDPEVFLIGTDTLGLKKNGENIQTEMQNVINSQAGWSDLTAVKNKQTYAISYSSALNYETFYANLLLAKIYYPEYFKDIDPDMILKEFYDRFMPFEYEGKWWAALE